MFFQGRGNVYLAELDGNQVPGPFRYKLCSDTFGFKPKVTTWSHQNKCGPVDVEDARGIQTQTADVFMQLADMSDKVFALGIFGTVNGAESPGSVVNEVLPAGILAGDYWFAGGKERHRNLTGVTIVDQAAAPLLLTTNYTVDAASGRISFVTPGVFVQPFKLSYGYTDPASVSIFTGGQREFLLAYEMINKQAANAPGGVELYRVRFDPADNLDFQSPAEQSFILNGSALADLTRDVNDTELGQFGRRVLTNAL
jgi:hypothetical protein